MLENGKGYEGQVVWIGKRQYTNANMLAKQIREVGVTIKGAAPDGSDTKVQISFSEALLREWERTDEPRPGGTT